MSCLVLSCLVIFCLLCSCLVLTSSFLISLRPSFGIVLISGASRPKETTQKTDGLCLPLSCHYLVLYSLLLSCIVPPCVVLSGLLSSCFVMFCNLLPCYLFSCLVWCWLLFPHIFVLYLRRQGEYNHYSKFSQRPSSVAGTVRIKLS